MGSRSLSLEQSRREGVSMSNSASVSVNGFRSVIEVNQVNNNNKGEDERSLFPASLLHSLDLSQSRVEFKNNISVSSPGEGLRIRPLNMGDYDRGFLQLLGQLTSVGDISHEAWCERFSEMEGGTYYVVVIEDTRDGRVVGATTLVKEKKFIHQCGQVGRIEDVVVSDQYRGQQLGKLIVVVASLLAAKIGCYKVTLNCNDKMVKFYNSLGYTCEEGNANYMCIRL